MVVQILRFADPHLKNYAELEINEQPVELSTSSSLRIWKEHNQEAPEKQVKIMHQISQ